MSVDLTKEQRDIIEKAAEWYFLGFSSKNPYISIGGYAGTGKTTIIPHLVKRIKDVGREVVNGGIRIAYCAFTGKAAFVIETKIGKYIDYRYDTCSTIHSLMYWPEYEYNHKGEKVIVGWTKKDELEADLIIIDEASMVNEMIFLDLLEYNIPIIAIGDHGQLPPIKGNFNLMEKPDFMLKEIHRQALNNPIIKVATNARRHGFIHFGAYSNNVFKLHWRDQGRIKFDKINWDTPDIICLTGLNATRVQITKRIRRNLGYKEDVIYPGERAMCLKNNHDSGIMNGQLGTVDWSLPLNEDYISATIAMDSIEGYYQTIMYAPAFGQSDYGSCYNKEFDKDDVAKRMLKKEPVKRIDLFDFGYATTVHKSQGSEWNRVVLFEQRNRHQSDDDYRRWLYTAVTRAKEKLFVIGNYWGQ